MDTLGDEELLTVSSTTGSLPGSHRPRTSSGRTKSERALDLEYI